MHGSLDGEKEGKRDRGLGGWMDGELSAVSKSSRARSEFCLSSYYVTSRKLPSLSN